MNTTYCPECGAQRDLLCRPGGCECLECGRLFNYDGEVVDSLPDPMEKVQEEYGDDPISFIKKFSRFSDAEEMFTQGLCYWFAYILYTRFNGEIYYVDRQEYFNQKVQDTRCVINHFITKIDDSFYDITGDVTWKYTNPIPWKSIEEDDPLLYNRLVRDCIKKIDYYPGGLWNQD
jgi:hypothetical protein